MKNCKCWDNPGHIHELGTACSEVNISVSPLRHDEWLRRQDKMRPKPIQIVKALPEELFQHREWAEFLKIKTSHESEPSGTFYVSPDFIYDAIEFMRSRVEGIRKEMENHWDYLRIPPEISVVEELNGYSFEKSLAPKEEYLSNTGWLYLRVYARAYRLKPMSDEKALILRDLTNKYLENNDFNLVEEFKRRTEPNLKVVA